MARLHRHDDRDWSPCQSALRGLKTQIDSFEVSDDVLASISEKLLPLVSKFADRPLSATLPPLLVCTIISSLYVGWTFSNCGVSSSVTTWIFNGSFVLAVLSCSQAVLVEPGFVPECWKGDPEGLPNFVTQSSVDFVFSPAERKQNGQYRYCNKEKMFKPDRAHYCRAISRNVLRMDHYCPWLSTCIGYRNHKFFFLFLIYSSAATSTSFYTAWNAFAIGAGSGVQMFMIYNNFVLATLFMLIFTPFSCFHIWLASMNLTTIEFCARRENGIGFSSIYSLGVVGNLESILGDNKALWPLPVGGPSGDGLSWRTNIPTVEANAEGRSGETASARESEEGASLVSTVSSTRNSSNFLMSSGSFMQRFMSNNVCAYQELLTDVFSVGASCLRSGPQLLRTTGSWQ
eukprot:TRINITY_DN77298_c0_g1_i1.p1 TRINITY_DN77298_c0_g1~~TRINITY_DN77298_c0_g1_i1.p1  ORF type:complete len:412 (-),score=37.10 TRINITY_DN77298_c0_g1_i1:56-1261(-)